MTATTTGVDSGRRSSAPSAAWRSRAFGLDLEGEFPVSGLPPGRETGDEPPTRIELSSTAALDGAWGAVKATTLEDARGSDGRRVLAVDRDDRLRYRLATADWGNYLVSADGRSVQCAPPSLAELAAHALSHLARAAPRRDPARARGLPLERGVAGRRRGRDRGPAPDRQDLARGPPDPARRLLRDR